MANFKAAALKMPAYGRKLIAARRAGKAPDCRGVLVTDSWKTWEKYDWRVVIPDDAVIGALDFSFVAGLEVIVIAKTEQRVSLIGAAVACFNPKRVVGISLKPPRIIPMVST